MKEITNIKEILHIVGSIEGWLSELEQLTLIQLPVWVDHLPGELVEIGSYKGKSTIALGLGSSLMSSKKRSIYAIDPFVPESIYYKKPYFKTFLRNLKKHGLKGKVIPIQKYSTEAYNDCPVSIAALFIDGDHEYSGVKHDIIHYASRVVPGGLVAFHDYNKSGVKKAVKKHCGNEQFRFIALYDSLLVIQKL